MISRAEKLRNVLKKSKSPQTCRELMDSAKIPLKEFASTYAMLINFQKNNSIHYVGNRQCNISKRDDVQCYRWNKYFEIYGNKRRK